MSQSYFSILGELKKLPHVQTYKAQRILFGDPFNWEQYEELNHLDKKERKVKLRLM